MSRDLVEENYYLSKGAGKIPVKWTAPEVSVFFYYQQCHIIHSRGNTVLVVHVCVCVYIMCVSMWCVCVQT